MDEKYLVEMNFHGHSHEEVNGGILLACLTAFPNDKIKLVCETSHANLLISKVSPSDQYRVHHISVTHDQIAKTAKRHLRGYYLSPFRRLLLLLQVCRDCRDRKGKSILLLSHNEFDLFAIRVINKIKKIPAGVICHGNLNEYFAWFPRNPIRRYFCYRSSLLKISHSNVGLICLERYVAENLKALCPTLAANIHFIPHPVLPLDKPCSRNFEAKRIAFVGRATPEKRYQLFEKLAELLNHHEPGGFQFDLIGRTHPGKQEFTSSQDMHEQLSSTGFICLLHDEAYYALSSTGVLLDAAKFKKPVAHLKNNLVRIIEDEFGEIGPSANTIEGLARRLILVTDAEIRIWEENLGAFAASRSPSNVASYIALFYQAIGS